MDIAAFQEEVKLDPLGRGYAQMTDAELYASVNEKNRSRMVIVGSRPLLEWAAAEGRYSKLDKAARNEQLPDLIRSVAMAACKLIDRNDTEIDLSSTMHMNLLNALVQASVLTQSDKDSLVALSTSAISRAEELGFADCSQDYMSYLRSLIS